MTTIVIGVDGSETANDALLGASADADLIVVGSRGLGGFERLMQGCVSDQVVHHATCPVLVVHPKT
jgi:nucleotide-binding universal stress UspA family protein